MNFQARIKKLNSSKELNSPDFEGLAVHGRSLIFGYSWRDVWAAKCGADVACPGTFGLWAPGRVFCKKCRSTTGGGWVFYANPRLSDPLGRLDRLPSGRRAQEDEGSRRRAEKADLWARPHGDLLGRKVNSVAVGDLDRRARTAGRVDFVFDRPIRAQCPHTADKHGFSDISYPDEPSRPLPHPFEMSACQCLQLELPSGTL